MKKEEKQMLINKIIRDLLIKSKLSQLLEYGLLRSKGSTEAEIKGVKNISNALLVVVNENQKTELSDRYALPLSHMITIGEIPEKLLGRSCPIVIDHFALQLLFEQFISDLETILNKSIQGFLEEVDFF